MNGRGKALCRLQNSPGSLFNKVALAVGIPDLKTTDLRRSIEGLIQGSEDMKKNSGALNMHSEQVGKQHYDLSKFTVRPEFVNHVEHMEGSSDAASKEETLTDFEKERLARMHEVEMEDAIVRRNIAQKFMSETKKMKGKNDSLGPRRKVNPLDRAFLQTLVHQQIFMCAENPQFPRGK